jgi:hypothetical protein
MHTHAINPNGPQILQKSLKLLNASLTAREPQKRKKAILGRTSAAGSWDPREENCLISFAMLTKIAEMTTADAKIHSSFVTFTVPGRLKEDDAPDDSIIGLGYGGAC